MKLLRYGIVALVALLFIGIAGFVLSGGKKNVVAEYQVTKGDLSNNVRVFGRAEPNKIYALAFEIGGKLVSYPFEVGDTVSKSARLAALSSSDIQANIQKATSQVSVEKSRFNKLTSSDSPEEIAIQESRITKQEQIIIDTERNLLDKLFIARNSFSDVVDNNLDREFFQPDSLEGAVLRLKDVDNISPEFRKDLSQDRKDIQQIFIDLSNISDGAEAYELFDDLVFDAQILIEDLVELLEGEQSLSAAERASRLEDDHDNLESLLIGLSSDQTSFSSSLQDLEILRNELILKQTGASSADQNVQSSIIKSKQADVNALYSDLSKYRITSPISGRVFRTFYDLYENVSPNTPVISIIEDEPFVVRANVAESDIVYVGIGNRAEIDFDAISDISFTATVSFIEEAVDESRTVPTYETTFIFDEGQDISIIKSGMTANIIVKSGVISDIVVIPQTYIISDEGGQFVYVATEKKTKHPEQSYITTGYRSNIGDVEILTGLQEGQTVLLIK